MGCWKLGGVLPARPPFATPSGTLRSHPDLSSQGGHRSPATQYSCNKTFSYAGHCAKRWALCPQRTYNLIGPRCTWAPAANRSCFVSVRLQIKSPGLHLSWGPVNPTDLVCQHCPALVSLQLHAPLLFSSKMPQTTPSQDLGTCHTLCLECSSPNTHIVHSLPSFTSLHKCPLLREGFPDDPS